MREIKFRCWHKTRKQMFWFDITWGNRHATGGGWICALPIEETELKPKLYHGDNRMELDPDECEFMQFTGLHDKNGKEIYEGDVVRKKIHFGGESEVIGRIIFDETKGCWMAEEINPQYNEREYLFELLRDHNKDDVDFLGNIYENPELLKTEPA